jgi:tRNA G10  N-methylase Trm11
MICADASTAMAALPAGSVDLVVTSPPYALHFKSLIEQPQSAAVQHAIESFNDRIEHAEWRVISARKADSLLRTLLFERVFAVRQRTSPRTQVNMHFSLKRDLTPFAEFARLRKEYGLHGLAVRLEAGDL